MLDKKMELEDYLEKYKLIVSTSGDFLALIDKNYVYQAINDTYLNYFNKTKDEIVGHCAVELYGKEEFEQNIKECYDRALSGESLLFEKWVSFPIGRRCIQVQYFPYREKNKENIEYFVVSGRDITEKKKVDEQLRVWKKVFEHTSEAIMVCDENMKIVTVNDSFSKITGYKKDEAIGKKSNFINYENSTDSGLELFVTLLKNMETGVAK